VLSFVSSSKKDCVDFASLPRKHRPLICMRCQRSRRYRCYDAVTAASLSLSRMPQDLSQKLPKAKQQIEEWQTAVEVLILVAESSGGPTMMARIGVMRALNRHVEREFNPDRKDKHWGKRKLKRDR
jgi:hypothetical protein